MNFFTKIGAVALCLGLCSCGAAQRLIALPGGIIKTAVRSTGLVTHDASQADTKVQGVESKEYH